jgi:cobalt/nickel transport system permease protein
MTLTSASFPEASSFIHHLDPRWKLAAVLPSIVAMVLVKSLPVALIGLFSSFLLILLSRLPLRRYMKRMAGLSLFLAVFVLAAPFLIPDDNHFLMLGPVRASLSGLLLGLLTLTKALTISTLVLVLLATAPLDATFKAAHSLHVPGLFVQIAMMAYRYLFVFTAELLRLRIALRARGYRNRLSRHSYRTIGHVAGTLLVRGYERSERVGQAMRCRGFDGKFRSLVDFRTSGRDVIAFCSVLVIASGLLAWDWSLR